MPVIIEYIIKLNICLAVVYLFYQFFLRRLTFYGWNRWYLLGYTLLSFAIPLIDVMPSLQKQNLHETEWIGLVPVLSLPPTPIASATVWSTFSTWDWAVAVLGIGALALSLRLFIRLYSLARLKRNAELVSNEKTKIYLLKENVSPFSFGNAIYLNKSHYKQEELAEIVQHEFVHVKQKHSIDVLWSEVLCILTWYNPVSWLLKRDIKQNLEFIADDNVIQSGCNKKEYQYLLLKVIGNQQFTITNHFNLSSLKKRIVMMNTFKTAKIHLLRFAFLLPIIAVMLLSFRNQVEQIEHIEPIPPVAPIAPPAPQEPPAPPTPTIVAPTAPTTPAPPVPNKIVPTVLDTTPQLFLKGVKLENGAKPLYIVDGIEVENIEHLDPNSIKAIDVIKNSLAETYGEKGKNGVILITTKKAAATLKLRNLTPGVDPIYVIDGVTANQEKLALLDPSDIASISVLKDQNAKALYGSKGENGVVLITTTAASKNTLFVKGYKLETDTEVQGYKTEADVVVQGHKATPDGQVLGVGITSQAKANQPNTLLGLPRKGTDLQGVYIVLDGEPITQAEMDKLNPNDIKEISVLKNDATKYYGKKAKNGAIIITSKKQ